MNRRLADKIMDALETAWAQGRDEFARRLELIHQALVEEEEAGIKHNRRATDDDEFDAEDSDSFLRHKMYQEETPEDKDGPEGDTVSDDAVSEDKKPADDKR